MNIIKQGGSPDSYYRHSLAFAHVVCINKGDLIFMSSVHLFTRKMKTDCLSKICNCLNLTNFAFAVACNVLRNIPRNSKLSCVQQILREDRVENQHFGCHMIMKDTSAFISQLKRSRGFRLTCFG